MLQAFGLSFTPDPRSGPLFENLDICLGRGEKAALVGRNGCGKSQLMRILAGVTRPANGRVVLDAGTTVAFMPQDFGHGFAGLLEEFLRSEVPGVQPHVVAKALHRFDLGAQLLSRPFEELSLGERTRGLLAALLATAPDILLLDEPTNHLDLDARMWFETFIREANETVLFVCHDRATVNAVSDRVIELDQEGLHSYAGGYDDMVAAKALTFSRSMADWERHRSEVGRLQHAAEDAAQRAAGVTAKPAGGNYNPKAKPFFAAKQARMDKTSKAMLGRAARVREQSGPKPFVERDPSLDFPTVRLRSAEALSARKLLKSFGPRILFEDLNVTLERGGRLAITGPNGVGKSTLLRILTGEEAPSHGEITWAPDVRIACLSQGRDAFALDKSAAEILSDPTGFGRSALGRLGMRGSVADRPMRILSMGERTKVEIVAMMLAGANVLILDEPTNHLDLPSVEALEEALREFPGAALFTSHDRRFVQALATDVLELQ